jgi:hypothetical protein
VRAAGCCSAAFRKHTGHKQSSPAAGIGSRNVSSLHQHDPAGSQSNALPQREQTNRRNVMLSVRFVMKVKEIPQCFHAGFIPNGAIISTDLKRIGKLRQGNPQKE